jgi:hypothetical protein
VTGDGGGPEVRGGLGSAELRHEDMLEVAGGVDGTADRLREVAGRVAACASDPDVLAGALLAPVTAARATAEVLDAASGPGGLVPLVIRMEGTATWVRATVEVHLAFDAGQAAALDLLQDAAGAAVGLAVWGGVLTGVAALPGVLVAGAVVALAGGTVLVTAATAVRWSRDLADLAEDALDGDLDPADLPSRLAALAPHRAVAGGLDDLSAAWDGEVGPWLQAFGGSVAEEGVAALEGALFLNPWVWSTLGGGAEGLVPVLTAPLGGAEAAREHGVPWPPETYEQAVALLVAMGEPHDLLQDGPATVTPLPEPVDRGDPDGPLVPTGIEDVFRGQAQLMPSADVDAATSPEAGRVRVIEVAQPDGSSAWVVQLPGTQVWSPEAGPNPVDLTSNVWLEARRRTATMQAAQDALRHAMAEAGVDPGDRQPVMLTGHSQGGITAAALAADPSFTAEFEVTHVVTAGAPIARIPVPPDVRVLALEHERDPVARLEGEENPDRAHWVTVTADRHTEELGRTAAAVHGGQAYVATAAEVDASDDPSLVAYREGAAAFTTGEGTVTDYRVRRTP